MQEVDGKEVLVECCSKQLNKYEKNYHTSEKELYAIVFALNKWYHHLLLRKFVVYTDHKNLMTLLNYAKSPGSTNKRLIRWAQMIQEFAFEARYIAGPENVGADYLSREGCKLTVQDNMSEVWRECPHRDLTLVQRQLDESENPISKYMFFVERERIVKGLYTNQSEWKPAVRASLRLAKKRSQEIHECMNEENDVDAEDVQPINQDGGHKLSTLFGPVRADELFHLPSLAQYQREDAYLLPIIQYLNHEGRPDLDDLPSAHRRLINNNQLKLGKDHVLRLASGDQIFVPACFRPSMVEYFHTHVCIQHRGETQTYGSMEPRVFWPGMRQDVKDYVKFCHICQVAKGSPKAKGELQLFEATAPFEWVNIDLIGPMPTSELGNRFSSEIRDRFTRNVRSVPVPDKRADTIAKAFVTQWILLFGAPKYLLSDRGSEFISEIFHLVAAVFGVEQRFTTPYHPQTSGQYIEYFRFQLPTHSNS